MKRVQPWMWNNDKMRYKCISVLSVSYCEHWDFIQIIQCIRVVLFACSNLLPVQLSVYGERAHIMLWITMFYILLFFFFFRFKLFFPTIFYRFASHVFPQMWFIRFVQREKVWNERYQNWIRDSRGSRSSTFEGSGFVIHIYDYRCYFFYLNSHWKRKRDKRKEQNQIDSAKTTVELEFCSASYIKSHVLKKTKPIVVTSTQMFRSRMWQKLQRETCRKNRE